MTLKHVAVTRKQFDKTWNDIPAYLRFWAEDEPRYKAGISCFVLRGMLIWTDYLLPEDQWSEEVQNAVDIERCQQENPEGEITEA